MTQTLVIMDQTIVDQSPRWQHQTCRCWSEISTQKSQKSDILDGLLVCHRMAKFTMNERGNYVCFHCLYQSKMMGVDVQKQVSVITMGKQHSLVQLLKNLRKNLEEFHKFSHQCRCPVILPQLSGERSLRKFHDSSIMSYCKCNLREDPLQATLNRELRRMDLPNSNTSLTPAAYDEHVIGEPSVNSYHLPNISTYSTPYHEVCMRKPCWTWSHIASSVFLLVLHSVLLSPATATNSSAPAGSNSSVPVLNITTLISHASDITESSINATAAIATQNVTVTTPSLSAEDISNVTLDSFNSTDFENVTFHVENVTVRALPVQHSGIAVGGIVGITLASIILCLIFTFIVIYLVTQRRAKNAAEGKGNHSNHYTGLNDDNIMLSYINSQFDVPKDSQEEMISLDNDAYLNSLESMIASNWTTQRSNTRF